MLAADDHRVLLALLFFMSCTVVAFDMGPVTVNVTVYFNHPLREWYARDLFKHND